MAYAKFTPEMKKTYTILAPNMLPIHFHLLIRILEQFGYHVVLLESTSRTVVEEGLKNVHNDTCYPALLVVGQFMEALKSGKYDVDHTALLITQTGGGCRASNYIHLLRKCMAEQFPQVPVLSLNFAGLENDCSLELTPALCLKMVYAVLYADLLMTLYNQCRPYELNEGESQQVLDAWQEKLPKLFESNKFLSAEKIYAQILKDFAAIPRSKKQCFQLSQLTQFHPQLPPACTYRSEQMLPAARYRFFSAAAVPGRPERKRWLRSCSGRHGGLLKKQAFRCHGRGVPGFQPSYPGHGIPASE